MEFMFIAQKEGKKGNTHFSQPESEVDPLLLAVGVLGDAVEPVLLDRPLHQQQGTGEQREPDKVRRTLNKIS